MAARLARTLALTLAACGLILGVAPPGHAAAPTASGTAITTAEDTAKTGNLPTATDPDGDTVTYFKASDPAHGTLVVTASGSYTYTPTADYHGADSFTYTVSDGNGGSNTYTVGVTVTAVNDAPTASGTALTTAEDTAKTGNLPVATDPDGDTVTYAKASNPAHGTLVINASGTYTYTPTADYHGADSFTYTVSDGNGGSNTYTVTVTVTAVNDAPLAMDDTATTGAETVLTVAAPGLLANDTDVDGDTLTASLASAPAHGTAVIGSLGGYTYTPDADFSGTDSFTYRVSDGTAQSTATVTITVAAPLPFINPTVAITGTAKVGSTLSAIATSTPTATDVTYTWFNGTTSLGTGPTYDLTDADEGAQIHVVAHLSATGYRPGTATSTSVGPIATRMAPTITLGASTTALRLGKTTTLTWTSTRATTVTGSGAWTGTLSAAGTRQITPQATGTQLYVISATNANGTTRAQIALTTTLPATTLKVRSVTKAKGAKLRVTVRGLAARESYSLTIAGHTFTGTATATGTAARTIAAPQVKKARKATITVTGSLPDRRGTTRTTLKPTTLKLSVDHRTVRASDPVGLTVTRLNPGERVTVRYAGRTITTGRASGTGTYRLTFNPGRNWGKQTVKVTAGHRSTTTTITVTRRCAGRTTCA